MTAEEYRASLEKAIKLIPIIVPRPEKEVESLASFIVGYKCCYESRQLT